MEKVQVVLVTVDCVYGPFEDGLQAMQWWEKFFGTGRKCPKPRMIIQPYGPDFREGARLDWGEAVTKKWMVRYIGKDDKTGFSFVEATSADSAMNKVSAQGFVYRVVGAEEQAFY